MRRQAEQGQGTQGLRPSRWPGWRNTATTFVALAAVTALLVGCGADTTKQGSGSDVSGSGSTTSTSTDLPAPKQWVIKASDLPQGWENSNPPDGDFGVTVCGVDIEPVLAMRAGAWRWSQSGLGPFLEQHVRVYRNDQAREVIAALQKALPTCTKTVVPRSKGSSEKVTFSIKPITVAGAGPDSVAWHQTVVSDQPVTSEMVLVRRGRTLVLFNSYTIASTLDRNVLVRAVAGLQVTPPS